MELRTNLPEAVERIAPSQATDDGRLIQKCLDGDERAWRALVKKYKRLVFSIPLKVGLQPSEAAIIFQSVWTDVLEDLGRLQDVTKLKKWLIVLTFEKCGRDRLQKNEGTLQRVSVEISEKAELNSELVRLYGQVELEQAVREAMEALPPHCAALIYHLFFEEPQLPYWRMAERIGVSSHSTGPLIEHSLECLRAVLEDLKDVI